MLDTQYSVIDQFLRFYPSKATKKVYKSVLNKFFHIIECEPNDYFDSKRDYEADLYNFALSIQQYAPKSFHSYIIIIKQFLLENNIEVNPRLFKKIRRLKPGTRAITRDRLPTNEELKRILSYSDLKMSTLILFLLSSGCRIGEATKLKMGDIDLEHQPTKVYIRGAFSKTGEGRTVFLSGEATLYLKEWLKNHDSYLQAACNRLNLPGKTKDIKDNRVFPFNESSVNSAFKRLLRLSGLDEKDSETNRHLVHIHCLRKYFRTKMALVIPLDIVELLLGHSGYLSSAYVRHTDQDLANYYKQGMSEVTVFGGDSTKEIEQLQSEIIRRDRELESLKGRMDTFSQAMVGLEELKKWQKEIKLEKKDKESIKRGLKKFKDSLKTS